MSNLIVEFPEPKFADETLNYEVDWRPRLGVDEEIVGTPDAVASGGIVIESHTVDAGISKLRISGGDVMSCSIEFLATTNAGQKIGVTALLNVFIR